MASQQPLDSGLILQQIRTLLAKYSQPKPARLFVAYSGGLDSTVLLHLLAKSTFASDLYAIHVNHQLSAHAGRWVKHCRSFAHGLSVPLSVVDVDVSNQGKGLEAAARRLRYQVFSEQLGVGDLLLSAHHQNDQAETLLFRLCRGAGLAGLSGIAPLRQMPLSDTRGSQSKGNQAKVNILRPLLACSRAQLEHYASCHQLDWVEDESNLSTDYDRNYLRHRVLPKIIKRWPYAASNFSRTAELLGKDRALLDEYASQDLQNCDVNVEKCGHSLCLQVLNCFSSARRDHVLRYWLAQCGFGMPSVAHLEQVERMLLSAQDSQAKVIFGQCQLHRYRQRLYCLAKQQDFSTKDIAWSTENVCKLPDGSQLLAKSAENGLSPGQYTISFRGDTVRCQPADRGHSQTLKKLLQEYRLEPWLRGRVPLIYKGGQLAAVGDLWVCEPFFQEGAGAMKLHWTYNAK